MDFRPMIFREAHEGEHVGFRVIHEGGASSRSLRRRAAPRAFGTTLSLFFNGPPAGGPAGPFFVIPTCAARVTKDPAIAAHTGFAQRRAHTLSEMLVWL